MEPGTEIRLIEGATARAAFGPVRRRGRGWRLRAAGLVSACVGVGLAAGRALGAGPSDRPVPLDRALEAALRTHPSLQAIAERIRIARARAKVVSSWPDPMLSVSAVNIPIWPPLLDETPMSGVVFSYTQPIPWPSKLSTAGRAAAAQAEVARWELEEARLQLAVKIWLQALRLAFLEEQRRILVGHDELLRRLEPVVRTKYAVSKASLRDVQFVALQRDQVRQAILGVRQAEAGIQALLSYLLGRPVRLEGRSLPWRRIAESEAELIRRALSQRPLLRAWQARIRAAELDRAHADTGYYPDFKVSASYRVRARVAGDPVDGMNFWGVGVSVSLPIFSWSRTKAAVSLAEHQAAAARAGLARARLLVASQVREFRSLAAELDGRIRQARQVLVPRARRTYDAAVAGYVGGRVDFQGVVAAARAVLKEQLELARLLENRAEQWTRLWTAVGDRSRADPWPPRRTASGGPRPGPRAGAAARPGPKGGAQQQRPSGASARGQRGTSRETGRRKEP